MSTVHEVPSTRIFLSRVGREIEAVLFDMDGVLVDSVPLHVSAWNAALQEYGLPLLDRAAYFAALGRTNLDMIERFLGRHGTELPFSSRKELITTKERLFRGLIHDQMRTMPGALQWLEFLTEEHIRCSVASSGELANIVAVLDTLHLADYFTSIISGARLPVSKPNPLIFELAAASVGVKPEKCLVVEDAPAGIQAAKAANMLCCALATSCPRSELAQADVILENFAEAAPDSFFAAELPSLLG